MALTLLAYFIVVLYTLALCLILLFSLIQLTMLIAYRRAGQKPAAPMPSVPEASQLPRVTVQLPVYNEREVAGRLIDNIVRLQYPADRLEIQVLDDSTDDTRLLLAAAVARYRAAGLDIHHLHRTSRQGYKAGALRDGLETATGEFVAIFDADFLPESDFLLRTIPHFADPRTGVVQTRWTHLNEEDSWLTRTQAFLLNIHFTIEQKGRQSGDYFLQFNGTAGVWRRAAIDDAGGWAADTLTEDLDLSYRAQLQGWKIKYLEDITAPAELPAEMHALKSQQFRWMKGGAENARKLIPAILRSALPFQVKAFAVAHLLSSSVFLIGLLLALLSFPAQIMFTHLGVDLDAYGIFLSAFVIAGLVGFVANRQTSWKTWSQRRSLVHFILSYPLFLSLSMGMSLHNSLAVIEGFRGKVTPFVRTPKYNATRKTGSVQRRDTGYGLPMGTVLEGLLAIYFLGVIWAGFAMDNTVFLPYHLMLLIGFGGVFLYSVKPYFQR